MRCKLPKQHSAGDAKGAQRTPPHQTAGRRRYLTRGQPGMEACAGKRGRLRGGPKPLSTRQRIAWGRRPGKSGFGICRRSMIQPGTFHRTASNGALVPTGLSLGPGH